jgi:ankyrin repeat protein
VEAARALLDLGANVHATTVNGDNPLHSARNAATVRLLLEAGADLYLRNHGGVTPLFRAVHAGHASAVTALVLGGASRDASDFALWTGLLVEAIGGNAEAVTTLAAASGERNRRLEENGHFARSPVQLAELHTTAERREELRRALADA